MTERYGRGRTGDTSGNAPVRAAQYLRMSTEHQQYPTENQAKATQEYAERRGIEIVRVYADEGKSGLSLGGRDALRFRCSMAECCVITGIATAGYSEPRDLWMVAA